MADKKTEIVEMIKEKLNIKEIDRDATISTYGLDSLDVVEFLLDLEERFDNTFDASETKGLKTVGELVDLIDKKVA